MLNSMMGKDIPQPVTAGWEEHPGSDCPDRTNTRLASPWHSLGSLWQRVQLLLKVGEVLTLALQPCPCSRAPALTYRRREKWIDY